MTELDFTPYATGAHINLGTIVHGGSKALYVKVDVLPSVADNTILTNSATVDATTPDPNAGNDTATAVTTSQASPTCRSTSRPRPRSRPTTS